MNSFSESYKAAGVDVNAGYKSVELMKQYVARTKIDGVVSGIGGFGGLFAPNVKDMEEPILVSGTDGVGTKIKLAFLLDKHDTIGIDSVAMCVNDVICCGAKPLFFLDYILQLLLLMLKPLNYHLLLLLVSKNNHSYFSILLRFEFDKVNIPSGKSITSNVFPESCVTSNSAFSQ